MSLTAFFISPNYTDYKNMKENQIPQCICNGILMSSLPTAKKDLPDGQIALTT